MNIPLTIITVVSMQRSDRIGAFVDNINTFPFFGIVTQANINEVQDCAADMVCANTDAFTYDELIEKIESFKQWEHKANFNLEFPEGNVSIFWETP